VCVLAWLLAYVRACVRACTQELREGEEGMVVYIYTTATAATKP